MAPIAIVFGILMVLLSGGLYPAAVMRGINRDELELNAALLRALTSMIPAAFGLVLIVLGMLARNASDRKRMHLMHAAALVGLIGVGIPGFLINRTLRSTEIDAIDQLRFGGLLGMALLSAVFLALCVRSFIQARIERKRKEAEAAK